MYRSTLWQIVTGALALCATSAAQTFDATKRDNSGKSSSFVTTNGQDFFVDGKPFKFVGTNAYYLPALNDKDLETTLASIKKANISVVRTWGFNDVNEVPGDGGVWFQLIADGKTSVNTGPNGLQRLDKVIETAEKYDLRVILSLTNNWAPFNKTNPKSGNLTRNSLSNDYGGMDTYVAAFQCENEHDQFYVNQEIIDAYKNYTTQVIKRYKESTTIFGWELANDSRCNSSLPASPKCNTNTVTQWHATLAQHVQEQDSNHLISSGNQGFICNDCPKLFQRAPTPPPQPSLAPGSSRRSTIKPLTNAQILADRKQSRKKTREAAIRAEQEQGISKPGVRVRGRWVATPTRRQDSGLGSANDGSTGVDSEDIGSIEQISFLSYQFFPDQNTYAPDDPNLAPINNTIQIGREWIKLHTDSAKRINKPSLLTAFGIVTQDNAPFFVPFNQTTAPFALSANSTVKRATSFPSDQERDDAYSSWLQDTLGAGIHYQWGQTGLSNSGITSNNDNSGQTGNNDDSGESPNDGYSTQGSGQEEFQAVISQAAQES